MIVRKTWTAKNKRYNHYNKELRYYHYVGWFLFGILPLYIIRNQYE